MTVKLARFMQSQGREIGHRVSTAGADPQASRERLMQSLRKLADDYNYWLATEEESEAIRAL